MSRTKVTETRHRCFMKKDKPSIEPIKYTDYKNAESKYSALTVLHMVGAGLSCVLAFIALLSAGKHISDAGFVIGLGCGIMFTVQCVMHCLRVRDHMLHLRKLTEYEKSIFPR